MGALKQNVVKKQWRFLVTYSDGRQEEIAVESESYHNAVYGLPKLGRNGHYEYLGNKQNKNPG